MRVVAEDENEDEYLTDQLYSDATSNLPNGVTSGSTADANNDGKADGFHTWGNFERDSMGDHNLIDTYTFGGFDSATTSLSVAIVDGTDNDGISSGIEAGAPNGGDGNGDGTADHLQDNVTSLPNTITGGGAYNTVQVTGCPALSDVSISPESALAKQDNLLDYPVGLLNFEVDCANPGDTADVTIFYDKLYDTTKWQARKFINNAYGTIPNAVFGSANVGGTQVRTLSYSLTDGGPLDDDGISNGTIVDPVGPGVSPTEVIAPPTTTGATGDLPATGSNTSTNLFNVLLLIGTGLILKTISKRYSRKFI